jgi:hypothetical protein
VATRLTKHLVFGETGDVPKRAFDAAGPAAESLLLADTKTGHPHPEKRSLSLDMFMAPRDKTIYLLHVGAEIEQALMVQYLYAAYSLGGPHITDPGHKKMVDQWKATILEIAREEMGHLVTVENTLTLIGGPITFERQDFPVPEDLYPFPFELEPLTRRSLGKYVLAEAPDDDTITALGLTDEMNAIKKLVGGVDDRLKVNRVGIVYSAIMAMFQPPDVPQEPGPEPPQFVASGDIQANSLKFQVDPAEWGLGYQDILIETATDRTSAIAGINAISVQGEGSTIGQFSDSHFGKFLEIYRQFPGEGSWRPSKNVARNPTTDSDASADRFISNETAFFWAGLLNLRYRMLLMYLTHSFTIETPEQDTARTPRGLLVSWGFGEMYHIRSITEILMKLPLIAEGGDLLAGPPFEMPYSLLQPTRQADRWRGHRDLLMAAQKYVDKLLELTGVEHEKYLKGMRSSNNSALAQVQTLIGG